MSEQATAVNPSGADDIRPVVANKAPGNWGLFGFIAVLLLGGGFLFNAMNAARQTSEVPSTLVPSGDDPGRITSPRDLALPTRFAEQDPAQTRSRLEARDFPQQPREEPVLLRTVAPSPAPQARRNPAPLPNFLPAPLPVPIEPAPLPQVVFDNRSPAQAAPSNVKNEDGEERVLASRFQNPSRTVPKGTVIPAVLETALDSTRPGGVRALVQRNVKSFDGTRILIQRGSRLYGEYDADLEAGQKRARIQWTRLIRPDGVTIALDSPASDPLGRAGVKGKVDTKFLQRFGGALLQSVLDIGVGIATREASDGVLVALPGSTQNVQISEQQTVRPTLKVKHGTSVSVFVARDLDFSTVEF